MSRYREDVYEPVPRMRLFDEGVVDSYRVQKALAGRMRFAGLGDYAQGRGDFETLCRALTMLGELYDLSCREFYPRSVLQVFRLCRVITPGSGLGDVLDMPLDVRTVDGGVDLPNLIGWLAVCAVKGGQSFDCRQRFDDGAGDVIAAVFNNFDRLDIRTYDEARLKKIYWEGCDNHG